jgi:hypothetical protein
MSGVAHTGIPRCPEKPTDEELMESYRDGDAGAFDQLYGRHRAAYSAI